MIQLFAASTIHAPIQTLLLCCAAILFALGAIPYEPATGRFRGSLTCAGLLCWLIVWAGWVS